jgi:ATP-dependent Clp protease protease subunit
MHPTGGGAKGYTEDVRIATREQERIQTQLFHLMGKHSGHTWKEIEEYFLRDKYMSAPEAKEFGPYIDEVLGDTSDVVVLNQPEITMNLFKQSENLTS